MSLEVFTAPWVERWGEELQASDAYRRAAATWEGSLRLEMAADSTAGVDADRAVFLDLWHGDCRVARLAPPAEGADYVLRAAPATWRKVLDGSLDPLFGLMSGKLKLVHGSLGKLTPQVQAARELVKAAARVAWHFPGEQGTSEPISDSR